MKKVKKPLWVNIVDIIKRKDGHSIKSYEIIAELDKRGLFVVDAELRRQIKAMQVAGFVKYIISDVNGFRISRRKADVIAMIENLESRRAGIGRVIKSLKSQI